MAFTHYTAFTVESGQVPSEQTNFPVLLKPTDDRFRTTGNGGNVANANGYDLRPYADSGASTPLDYELVPGTYDPATGTFEMHVKVPSLDVGSVIYLFYGDAARNTDGSSADTWDSNFKLVLHLGDGSTLSVADSTANGNDGTNANVTAVDGQVAGGGGFNGTNTQITGTISATAPPFTIELWARVDGATTAPDCGFQFNTGAGNNGIRVRTPSNNGKIGLTFGGVADYEVSGIADFVADVWMYCAVTCDANNGTGRFYSGEPNGTFSTNSTAVGTVSGTPSDYTVGNDVFGNFVIGRIDEVRYSSSERSADWIEATFNNQNAPGSFYSIGAEQSASATMTPVFLTPTAPNLRWR